MKRWLLSICLLNLTCGAVQAKEDIPLVQIRPVLVGYYSCTEHWEGQLHALGDARGTDCWTQQLTTVDGRTWMRAYQNTGQDNADWYGWEQPVLAPFDAEVELLHINATVNPPGVMGKGPASYIVLKRADGLRLLLAHIRKPKVQIGEQVQTGRILALVGNNGQSRHPHIHLGAWKDKTPYQIRFDLRHITQF